MKKAKKELTKKEQFDKIKKKIQKKYPTAQTCFDEFKNEYYIGDENKKPILPIGDIIYKKNVFDCWNETSAIIWTMKNVIGRTANYFSEEKSYNNETRT